MNYEKVLTRDDKSKVKITIRSWMDGFGSSGLKYDVEVATRLPKKRLWNTLSFSDDYSFRSLSMPDRAKFLASEQLKVVSKEEIYNAKLEAWELLKP